MLTYQDPFFGWSSGFAALCLNFVITVILSLLGGPAMNRPDGKKVLERISSETGGRFFEVSKKQPIDKVFASIEEDLRHQYSIGYTPTAAAPGYRHIHVAAKQKGLTVQAREGYYAL